MRLAGAHLKRNFHDRIKSRNFLRREIHRRVERQTINSGLKPGLTGKQLAAATVLVRAAIPAGSAFLEGNLVEGPLVQVRRASSAVPAQWTSPPSLSTDASSCSR